MTLEKWLQLLPNIKLALALGLAILAVRVPIDNGRLGYRVFLIRREDQPHFTNYL